MMITLIWTWLFNNTKGSILMAVFNHAAFNATGTLIAVLVPAALLGGWLGNAALGVLTVLLLIFTKGRLSYNPEQNAQIIGLPKATEMTQA
jgi:hypothetical protein